jgi:hypothetical protein
VAVPTIGDALGGLRISLKASIDEQLFVDKALAKGRRVRGKEDKNLEVFHRYTSPDESSAQSSYMIKRDESAL